MCAHSFNTPQIVTLQLCIIDCAQAIKNLAIISGLGCTMTPPPNIFYTVYCFPLKGQQTITEQNEVMNFVRHKNVKSHISLLYADAISLLHDTEMRC